jgi:hypothetical protein
MLNINTHTHTHTQLPIIVARDGAGLRQVRHISTTHNIAYAIRIVFSKYPNIRIVWDIWLIQIFVNSIRILVFVTNTRFELGIQNALK